MGFGVCLPVLETAWPHAAPPLTSPRTVIDLHCHLLPGIDDGPDSVAEAVSMARAYAREGVRAAAATPHLRADHPAVRPDELGGRVADLREELQRAEVDLDVVVGGEVDVFWAERASDEDLRLVSYEQAGRVVLIETPYGHLSDIFEDLLNGVVGRGYRVLLAHPERNPSFQRAPRRLLDLADDGILLQVNAGSLTVPARDPEAGRLASRLLRRGAIDVVATDAHGPGPWRPPNLARARADIEGRGDPQGRWLTQERPASLLRGTPPPARPEPRRGALDRLLGR